MKKCEEQLLKLYHPKPILCCGRLCLYNLGHNILTPFNNLAEVGITTSKAILDV